MPDRRRQVVQLLASRYDQLYLPAGALRTPSGLSPAKRVPCPDCGITDHPGFVIDQFKRPIPCVKCGGSIIARNATTTVTLGGYAKDGAVVDGQLIAASGATKDLGGALTVEHKRGKGHIYVDPMDANQVPVGSTETTATARPRKVVTCDRCAGEGVWKGERCILCDGHGTRPQHIFELHIDNRETSGDPMTDAIERRNESGSYRELGYALAGIRVHRNKPTRYRWLTVNATAALRLLDELTLDPVVARDLEHGVYPFGFGQPEQQLVELALDYLQWRLPDPIRVPAEVRANAKITAERRTRAKGRGSDRAALAQRDRELRLHARRGRSVQWIAAEYGLSVRAVYEVVNERRTA